MKEETVLSLKWQSFPSHLTVSLDTCYEKQQFVDLSLVCKDGTILKCHKMVLANSSTFFRRLLVANEHPHPMIILHDIEADDLKTIVNFMYCGEIQVVQSEVRRLLKLAEILEVTGLRHVRTSVLGGEKNNTAHDTSRKTTTVTRLKSEEAKGFTTKTVPDHNPHIRPQNKTNSQATRFTSPSHSHKLRSKIPLEATKQCDDNNIHLISQRLDTGKSGISIIDINDMPSTSRGIGNPSVKKRNESFEPVISWPHVLSSISQDEALPLKKLCIMDEVEITPGKALLSDQDSNTNAPLDRRKCRNNSESSESMNCTVFIKDEIDIFEVEEDADMDPLEVEEVESENSDHFIESSQMYPVTNLETTYYSAGNYPEYPLRKGSNG